MWHLILSLFLLSALQPGPVGSRSTCVRCHQEFDGNLGEPVQRMAQDIHAAKGLSCHHCHGGDPTLGIETGSMADAKSRARGFIGRPANRSIAALCASCHSKPEYMRTYNPQARVDQHSEYLTSVHGKKNQAGDTQAATCTSCHGAHGVLSSKNPTSPVYATNVAQTCAACHADPERMKPYGIPTNQLELYKKSVHGIALIEKRDISAPTCNDCHGNHGAVPPGVDSVANVCSQCHVSQWDQFNLSPHREAFAANGFPACATCHEHHEIAPTSDDMIGVEDPAVCITCHAEGDAGYVAAKGMKDGIVRLKTHLDAAHDLLVRAERAGMEVSRPIYSLSEGRDRLVRARVEIHRLDEAVLAKLLEEGHAIAAQADQDGQKAMDELAFRRKGLAISSGILVVMIGLLIAKIRQRKTEAAE